MRVKKFTKINTEIRSLHAGLIHSGDAQSTKHY